MRTSRRNIIVACALTSLLAGIVWAQSPHFVRGPDASLDSDGNLVVSWKEAGLGNNVTILYTASATTANAIYACINKGGNHPQASNKQHVTGPVSCTGSFTSGKNGTITATLTCPPPAPTGGFDCPGGQTEVLTFVSYAGISLSDTTNQLTVAATPSSLSACLISGPLASDPTLCP